MSTQPPKPAPSVPVFRLPYSRWKDGLSAIPKERHAAYYDLCDSVGALLQAIKERFPMTGAVVIVVIYPTRGHGVVRWKRGGEWIEWRVSSK
jgi:hypothetical protein